MHRIIRIEHDGRHPICATCQREVAINGKGWWKHKRSKAV